MRLNRKPYGWVAVADREMSFRRHPLRRKYGLLRGRKWLGEFRTLHEAMEVARKHWRPNFVMYADARLRQLGGASRLPEIAAMIKALVETEDRVALLQVADWLTEQRCEVFAQHTLSLGKRAGIRLQ